MACPEGFLALGRAERVFFVWRATWMCVGSISGSVSITHRPLCAMKEWQEIDSSHPPPHSVFHCLSSSALSPAVRKTNYVFNSPHHLAPPLLPSSFRSSHLEIIMSPRPTTLAQEPAREGEKFSESICPRAQTRRWQLPATF